MSITHIVEGRLGFSTNGNSRGAIVNDFAKFLPFFFQQPLEMVCQLWGELHHHLVSIHMHALIQNN
jgi:hypothetical protein